MKLQYKFLFILLAFSLIPLLVVAYISHSGIKTMEDTVALGLHQRQTEAFTQELAQMAENRIQALFRNSRATELAVRCLARDVQAILAEEPPADMRIHWAKDFNRGGGRWKDMVETAKYRCRDEDGGLSPLKVSFSRPVYFSAPGLEVKSQRADAARLSRLVPQFKDILDRLGFFVHRVWVVLPNGLGVSYPGHGGYPANFDPRQTPAYERASEALTKIAWTAPYLDPATGRMIFSLTGPVRDVGGDMIGMVAVDVELADLLGRETMPYSWQDKLSVFLVEAFPHDGRPALRILARPDYESAAATTTKAVELEWLASDDPEATADLSRAILRGESGRRIVSYQGREALWAFATQDGQVAFVMIVPMSVIAELPDQTRQQLSDLAARQHRYTIIVLVAAFLAVMAVAISGARASVRSVLQLVSASKRLSKGDFSVRLEERFNDERDMLCDCFNDMVPKMEEHLDMSRSLGLAQEVQQSLLPEETPDIPGFDISAFSLYSEQTGGDYYDYLRVDDPNHPGFAAVVGDVSGHGVSAALLMATTRALLRIRTAQSGKPDEVITDVNRHLSHDTANTGQFVTLFYARFHTENNEICWVRAGHHPALVFDTDNGEFDELMGDGPALGLDEDYKYNCNIAKIRPGQVIFLGTDGIWETMNEQGDMFGLDRLRDLIRANAEKPAREIQGAVVEALDEFRGEQPFSDDVTMLVVKVTG
jgi:sigma-B regulation protein RsbU (phosphoserine phosphatase)